MVFADYPCKSLENPFNIDANGRYFAYLTNKQKCFSYLSNDLGDFKWGNNDLAEGMPFGYTNLWVLERLFIINSSGCCKRYSDTAYDKIATFRYNDFPSGEWESFILEGKQKDQICDYHRFLFMQDDINNAISLSIDYLNKIERLYGKSNLTILGAGLIQDYSWH